VLLMAHPTGNDQFLPFSAVLRIAGSAPSSRRVHTLPGNEIVRDTRRNRVASSVSHLQRIAWIPSSVGRALKRQPSGLGQRPNARSPLIHLSEFAPARSPARSFWAVARCRGIDRAWVIEEGVTFNAHQGIYEDEAIVPGYV